MQTVASDQPLGKGEAIRIVCDPAGLPTITAVRMAIDVAAFQPDKPIKNLGSSLTLSLAVKDAAGKARPLPLKIGEATAKWPVYRNGAEVPGLQGEWRLPKTARGDQPLLAVWLLDKPLVLAAGERIAATVTAPRGLAPGLAFSLACSPLAAVHPLDVAAAADRAALTTPRESRSSAQAVRVTDLFLLSTRHDAKAVARAEELAAQARDLCGGRTWTMVTQRREEPLSVRVLPRGNWQDQSGPVVLPATPSFLPARIESTAANRLSRLDLANWLVSDANPITPRAVVNRLWAMFFGTGLSAALDDLGSQGELPSHPELLDWLACEFRESGWNVKHVIRLIVTSRTYRQSSSLRSEALAVDPANRLLASQNPRRLEAEFVRDNALAIAGLLRLDEIGGPSVKPYQPPDYYASLQFPNRDYLADTDERQWRRGVYTHWQRTFLHPMLANFDAPARDECAAARSVSNTPQQALTLLNDPAFVEAARVFAARLLEDHAARDDAARIRLAYQLALNRAPRDNELASLTRFLATQREAFTAARGDAEKVLAVGLAPRPRIDPVEHAAWTQLARVLMNTQEVITRY
jgi:hypothetical protein